MAGSLFVTALLVTNGTLLQIAFVALKNSKRNLAYLPAFCFFVFLWSTLSSSPTLLLNYFCSGQEYFGEVHSGAQAWSKLFLKEEFEEYLFACGNGRHWMVIRRVDLESAIDLADKKKTEDDKLTPCRVITSSEISAPHLVHMFLNQQEIVEGKNTTRAPGGEPWITIWEHSESKKNHGAGFLYGGGSFLLEKPQDDGAAEHENFGLQNVKNNGGANVYIRARKDSKLGICLNKLSGSPLRDELSSCNDEFMWSLWRRAPHAVFAGAVHAHYRSDTVAWLAEQIKKGSPPLNACAGMDCLSPSWAMAAAAFSADLLALDEAGFGVPVSREVLAVRSMLCDLTMKGLSLGPLRQTKDVQKIRVDFGANLMWYAAVKAESGNLFFLPKSTFAAGVLILDTLTGNHRRIHLSEEVTSSASQLQEMPGLLYTSAVLGSDGFIYGIPGNALQVLRINPFNPGDFQFIGGKYEGPSKWGQGVLCPFDKSIYCAPCNNNHILQIQTGRDPTVAQVGEANLIERVFDMKWWGAVFVPQNEAGYSVKLSDGKYYCGRDIGQGALPESVGRCDPTKGRQCESCANTQDGISKGCVYFTPHNARKLLKFSPDKLVAEKMNSAKMSPAKFSTIKMDVAKLGSEKLESENMESDSSSVLSTVGSEISLRDGGKFFNACLCDGFIVASPGEIGDRKVLIFECATEKTSLVSSNLVSGPLNWTDTVVGSDAVAYGLTPNADQILRIEPKQALENHSKKIKAREDAKIAAKELEAKATGEDKHGADGALNAGDVEIEDPSLKLIGSAVHSAEANGCGVLGNDGYVYAAPMLSSRILRVNTLRPCSDPSEEGDFYTILWLWRTSPEIWFRFFCHPLYKHHFLKWFERQSGASHTLEDDVRGKPGDASAMVAKKSTKKSASSLKKKAAYFASQCGSEPANSMSIKKQAPKKMSPMKEGDLVEIRRVPERKAKELMDGHGGWVSSMKDLLGRSGKIQSFTPRGDVKVLDKIWNPALVKKLASSEGTQKKVTSASLHPWHDHPLALHAAGGWNCDGRSCPGGCRGSGGGGSPRFRCTEGCDYDLCGPCYELGDAAPHLFREGDTVRIRSMTVSEAKELAKGHGGWAPSMEHLLGSAGQIENIDSDGDVRVAGYTWNSMMMEIYLKLGDSVTFQISDSAAEWKRCPGAKLIFSAGAKYTVHSISGSFFTSTRFKSLYAPISAVVPPEIAQKATSTDRLRVGERVMLTEDYKSFGDAENGPLKPGDTTILQQDDKDSKPYKIRFNETSFFYEEGALRRVVHPFKVGDHVRIKKVAVAEVKRLAEGHGGWADSMEVLLGTAGKVTRVTDKGAVVVCDKVWNPAGKNI